MSKKIPSTKNFLTTFLHLLCERPETLGTILSVIRNIKNCLLGVFSFVFKTWKHFWSSISPWEDKVQRMLQGWISILIITVSSLEYRGLQIMSIGANSAYPYRMSYCTAVSGFSKALWFLSVTKVPLIWWGSSPLLWSNIVREIIAVKGHFRMLSYSPFIKPIKRPACLLSPPSIPVGKMHMRSL